MNAAPTWAAWLGWALVLGVGSSAVVGLAALLGRWTPSAVWRRTLWQACVLGLTLLLIGELSGVVGGWLAHLSAGDNSHRVEAVTRWDSYPMVSDDLAAEDAALAALVDGPDTVLPERMGRVAASVPAPPTLGATST